MNNDNGLVGISVFDCYGNAISSYVPGIRNMFGERI